MVKLSTTKFIETFMKGGKASLQTIYEQCIHHGVAHSRKSWYISSNGYADEYAEWKVTFNNLQLIFDTKNGNVESIKLTTENNLF